MVLLKLSLENNLFFISFKFFFYLNSMYHYKNILNITSLVLPHINPFSFDEEANFGDSVQLTCHVAKGDLPLKINWMFNGKPLFAHLAIVTTKVGDRLNLLTVPSVTGDNGGKYTCVATNLAGQSNHSTTLYVNGIFSTIYSHFRCNSFFVYFLFYSFKLNLNHPFIPLCNL